MKNILIMLDYYLPNASANGICCQKIIDEMKKKYNIFILCFNNQERNISKNVKLYSISVTKNKRKNMFSKVIFNLKWLNIFRHIPPYTRNEIVYSLLTKANEIIDEQNIDMVISVHLPIETLIVGNLLKNKNPNLILIAYMLDSCSGGFLPKLIPKNIGRKRRIHWENYLLKYYDQIFLMNSSRMHHELYTKYNSWYQKSIYLDIPMLTSKKEVHKEKSDMIYMIYAGSLDKKYRNPATIIEILKLLKDEKIICEFIGKCECEKDFEEIKEIYGSRLLFTKPIPYDKITDKIKKADILINIGNNNPNLIPSKIFEYMSYGIPIISTYDIDNDPSAEYLKKYPLSILIDGRKQVTKEILINQIYNVLNKKINKSELFDIFVKNTPKSFVEEINKVFEKQGEKNEESKEKSNVF